MAPPSRAWLFCRQLWMSERLAARTMIAPEAWPRSTARVRLTWPPSIERGLSSAEGFMRRPAPPSCPFALSSGSMMQSISSSSPPSILNPPRRRALEMCTNGDPVLRVKSSCSWVAGRMVAPLSPAIHSCEKARG
eukprot:2562798-Prymnesium_polylepis.1